MAKAEILTKPPVTLTLTHEEAKYIRTVMQNPYLYVDTNEEPSEEREMRNEIWTAINGVIHYD